MPTLIFKETEACNSNCIYCDVITRKKPKTISYELLSKVFQRIDEFLKYYPEELFSIVWHGGEPIMAGIDFYKKVLELQSQFCPETKHRIIHDMQSNLTLINQEFIDVFKEMGMARIGTSFEPYKGIRGFGEKRDSDRYNLAFFRGIELLEKNNMSWGFIYVVTRNVLDKPLDVFNILTNFKFQGGFQIHPVYLYQHEDPHNLSITAREFADFLGAVFTEWWSHRTRYPFVDPFHNYLKQYNGGGNLCCSESGKCAYSHIYIGPEGDYSHCGRSSDWDQFKGGNINDTSIIDAFKYDYRIEIEKRNSVLAAGDCNGCQYFCICNGGCPLDGWNGTGSISRKSEWCLSIKLFLKNYFEPITKLELKSPIHEFNS